MKSRLRGVLGPVATTFDAAGEIDREAFEQNLRAHLAAGLSGAVVCGSTGEAALLDESERLALVELARRVVPADRTLIVGTGAESTRLCIRRCEQAAERGADAVLVVSPHYYGAAMTVEALEAHFRRVADASPIPVLLYNIPKYAHLVLEPDLVARLAPHGNIAGMKDSAGDMVRFDGYLASQSDAFRVLTGHGGTFRTAIARGASGGILAVALFAPAHSIAAHEGGEAGELAQAQLVPLAATIVAALGVAGVKAAMDAVGLRGGDVRSPLLPVDASARALVATLLRDAGVPSHVRG